MVTSDFPSHDKTQIGSDAIVKALVRKQLGHKGPRLETTLAEETDEQEHLNQTQYPLLEMDLSMPIATITGDMNHNIWINAKSTMVISIQAEIKGRPSSNGTNTEGIP